MTKITLLNQPTLSEHEIDQNRNAQKKELVPKIEELVSNHKLFKDQEVTISFAQEGLTSLVAIINTGESKYVLKTILTTDPLEGEGEFLRVWGEDGVSVPHMIEEGVLNERPYTLMNFIDAPILSKAYTFEEMLSQNIFKELGSILSKMHKRNVKGYGPLHGGLPSVEDFATYFPEFATARLSYIQDHSILNDIEHGSISTAIDIIQHYVEKDGRSTYCHNAFIPDNIFATKPFTVFDPTPTFDHPYMDLGLTIVLWISLFDSEETAQQLIDGYFEDKTLDPKILHAFILFNSHRRIPRWHTTNRSERIERVQNYLKKHKGFLG